MSFASEVKKEILNNEDISVCCKKALLFGILQGTAEIAIGHGVKLKIKSPILNVIKTVISCLKDYEINIDGACSALYRAIDEAYDYDHCIKDNPAVSTNAPASVLTSNLIPVTFPR